MCLLTAGQWRGARRRRGQRGGDLGAGGAASRGTGGAAAGRVVGDARVIQSRADPGDAVTALPPEPAPRSGGAPPGQDPTVPYLSRKSRANPGGC